MCNVLFAVSQSLPKYDDLLFTGPTAVLISDRDNYCIRILKREKGNGSDVTPKVGTCGKRGNQDGENAMFSRLGNFVWDKVSFIVPKIIVADEFNDALRSVELNRHVTTTIISRVSGLTRPRYLLYDPDSNDYLYISMPFQISRFHIPSNTLQVLTGKGQSTASIGIQDGPFSTATFGVRIPEIKMVNNTFMVASDARSNMVRLLDLKNKKSYTICSDGKIAQLKSAASPICSFLKPHAVSFTKDHLYIGSASNIRKMPGETKLLQ